MAGAAGADTDALLDELREGHDLLVGLADRSEADTRQHLIDPVLDFLYPRAHIRREESDSGNRPDYVLYHKPVNESSPARAIVEAKPLGADFERAPSTDRAGSPVRQARRYLRDHPAGVRDTLGALTDGLRWWLYRKADDGDVEIEQKFDLDPLVLGEEVSRESLRELIDRLALSTRRQRQRPSEIA